MNKTILGLIFILVATDYVNAETKAIDSSNVREHSTENMHQPQKNEQIFQTPPKEIQENNLNQDIDPSKINIIIAPEIKKYHK